MKRAARSLLTLSCTLLCAACAPLGPDYARPAFDLPAQWKAAAGVDAARWQAAQPSDALPKQDWWTLFGDDKLNELIALSLKDSPTLQAAMARLDQALAQSNARSSAQAPSVQLGAAATRTRISANRPLSNYNSPNYSTVQDDYRPVISVSYEIDWLGRVRRDVESARASAEQAGADAENVRLLLTAQVASAYFQLRQLDEEIAAVSASVALQEKVLGLINKRYALGASGQGDLAQQTALTASSKAQLDLLVAQRSLQENLLATLTGTPAPNFRLAPGMLPANTPPIPITLPSSLLERRPDIGAAERAMAAANAQIGVARAAYFPALNLSPTYAGYEANALPGLLSAPSLVWSLGVLATQTLFDGGRADANVNFAKAGYALSVANYRQTVLTAVQEAQDALSSLQQLALARTKQDEAVRNWDNSNRISLIRYKEGLDNSITLATLQQNQLAAKRVQAQIAGRQFVSSVGLIKALGGGWGGLKAASAAKP